MKEPRVTEDEFNQACDVVRTALDHRLARLMNRDVMADVEAEYTRTVRAAVAVLYRWNVQDVSERQP